jgi:hypothetical protein
LLLLLVWVIIAYWQPDNMFTNFLCAACMCHTNHLAESFEPEGYIEQSGM